jgi:hypothetical protein
MTQIALDVTQAKNDVTKRQAVAALQEFWPYYSEKLINTFRSAAEALDRNDADVVFLGARRALALHHVMRLAGEWPKTRGIILSDRFITLEQKNSGWSQQRAWPIDDTRTHGEAQARLEEAVKDLCGQDSIMGGEAKVALIFPTDKDPDPAAPLHGQFARALTRAVVPLFADFPVTQEVTVEASVLADLFSTSKRRLWQIADVTNTAAADVGGRSYSLFPKGDFLGAFADRLGPAAALVRLVKFRVFAMAQGYGAYRVRAVPLVLLHDQPADLVCKWLVESGLRHDPGSLRRESAGLALMGFLLSRVLLDYMNDQLGDGWFGQQSLVEDFEFTQVAMTDAISQAASSGRLESLTTLSGLEPQTPKMVEPVLDLLPDWRSSDDMLVMGDNVVINRRRAVGETELDSVRVEFLQAALDALPKTLSSVDGNDESDGRGFRTLGELTQTLSDQVGHPVGEHTVSLALDVLNDLGNAVPVLRCRTDATVVRGYRRGEQVEAIPSRLPGRYAAFDTVEWAGCEN